MFRTMLYRHDCRQGKIFYDRAEHDAALLLHGWVEAPWLVDEKPPDDSVSELEAVLPPLPPIPPPPPPKERKGWPKGKPRKKVKPHGGKNG